MALYKHSITPVPSQEEWEKIELLDIYPPMPRKPTRRPKKKRIRGPDEPKNAYRVLRAGGKIVCGNYGQVGHNV